MIGFKSNLAFVVTYFLLSHYQRMDSNFVELTFK